MSKKFISFLGTNEYKQCHYKLCEQKTDATFFIQEALLQILSNEFSENDKAIILVTKEAENKNWSQRKNFKNEIISEIGLKQVLEKFKIKIEKIEISKGENEDEIWGIFNTLVSLIEENDELYFDVTHGFRSLPMLAMVVINYLKVLKNCKVKGIFYGAFETLGAVSEVEKIPLEERIAPIFDLTAFDNLLDWTFAVNQFLKNGSAKGLKELSQSSSLATELEKFTNQVATCRRKETAGKKNKIELGFFEQGKIINKFLNSEEFEIENKNLETPLKPLLKKLADTFSCFSSLSDEKSQLISLLEFCLEHNLIQQGLTIMEEELTTLICKKFGLNWEELSNRDLVGQLDAVSRTSEENWAYPSSENKEFIRNALIVIPSEILTMQGLVKAKRNDLNHCGINKQPKRSDTFSNCLKQGIKKLKETDFFDDADSK